MLFKSLALLSKKRKIEISLVITFVLINSFLEMLSIGLLLPLINYLINPVGTIESSFFFTNVIEIFFDPKNSSESFNIFLIIFLFIFVFKKYNQNFIYNTFCTTQQKLRYHLYSLLLVYI